MKVTMLELAVGVLSQPIGARSVDAAAVCHDRQLTKSGRPVQNLHMRRFFSVDGHRQCLR